MKIGPRVIPFNTWQEGAGGLMYSHYLQEGGYKQAPWINYRMKSTMSVQSEILDLRNVLCHAYKRVS